MTQNPNSSPSSASLQRVAYLGPTASFSHQAALAVFQHSATLVPHPSFSSIFTSLQQPHDEGDGLKRPYDFAILPIENSTNGSVVQVLDLLAQCAEKYPDLEVCAEHYLAVHHFLYGNHDRGGKSYDVDLKKVQTLYTHPQVWTQCSNYLARELQHAERIDVSSTSAAASIVVKDETGSGSRSSAAICSKLAGEMGKLRCLAENIEDEPDKNTTRFFVLRNRMRGRVRGGDDGLPGRSPTRQDLRGNGVNVKALLLFTIAHTVPGSLSKALEMFAKHGLNLTRIDTRPSRQHSWHYVFFVECEERVRNVEDETEGKLQRAVQALEAVTESVVCLGRWVDMLQFSQ